MPRRNVRDAKGIDVPKEVNTNLTIGIINRTSFKVTLTKYLTNIAVKAFDTITKRTIKKRIDTKLYKRKPYMQVTKDGLDRYDRLSKRAKELFKIILFDKVYNSTNSFVLNLEEIKSQFNIKENSNAYKLIKELKDNELISNVDGAKSNVYVINHNDVFKGSMEDFLDRYKIEILGIESEDGKGLENFEV